MWSLCRPLVSGPANTRHSPVIPGWRACACPGCVPGFVQAIGLPSALVGRYDWLLGLVVAVGLGGGNTCCAGSLRHLSAGSCMLARLPAAGGPLVLGGQPPGCMVGMWGAAVLFTPIVLQLSAPVHVQEHT
jgi:hypothetical protein